MKKNNKCKTLKQDFSMIYAKVMDQVRKEGADLEALADQVIATNEPLYIYHFAGMIKNAPIAKLTNAIVRTKNAEYIYYFAKTVENASVEELSYGISFTNDFDYIFYFAREIKGALIKLLSRAVIAMNDSSDHYSNYITFAANVPNAPVEDFAFATINTKDTIAIYLFALLVPNAPIQMLTEAIIKSKEAEYIYLFALNIKGADITRLAHAIIDTKDAKYIYLFLCNISNSPMDLLIDALIDLKNPEYLYKIVLEIPILSVEKNGLTQKEKFVKMRNLKQMIMNCLNELDQEIEKAFESDNASLESKIEEFQVLNHALIELLNNVKEFNTAKNKVYVKNNSEF